ncbi:hypothetical protein PoB_004796500 [Plakobranchus ocellatus]|uniref:RUN domain-containing protein n=1 Tax=Plakobranchus ocellatus TaxID=259542 RepID=A0AAV4BLP9_9GAST|nr:hypothetical protein PoB_004796500 [Plakobranchus ocellatus]
MEVVGPRVVMAIVAEKILQTGAELNLHLDPVGIPQTGSVAEIALQALIGLLIGRKFVRYHDTKKRVWVGLDAPLPTQGQYGAHQVSSCQHVAVAPALEVPTKRTHPLEASNPNGLDPPSRFLHIRCAFIRWFGDSDGCSAISSVISEEIYKRISLKPRLQGKRMITMAGKGQTSWASLAYSFVCRVLSLIGSEKFAF